MLWMLRISVTEMEAQHHYAHAEATGKVLSIPSTKNRERPYMPETEQFLKIRINNISRHKKIPLQKQSLTYDCLSQGINSNFTILLHKVREMVPNSSGKTDLKYTSGR